MSAFVYAIFEVVADVMPVTHTFVPLQIVFSVLYVQV